MDRVRALRRDAHRPAAHLRPAAAQTEALLARDADPSAQAAGLQRADQRRERSAAAGAAASARSLTERKSTDAHDGRDVRDFQSVELHSAARALDLDADGVALGVVVQHDPVRNFLAFHAGLLAEIDVQRIRFREIVDLHSVNPRSKNALWI